MKTIGSCTRFVSVVLFAPLVLTGCATFKAHPDFSSRHEHIQQIAVLPPDVEAYEITFNAGSKPLADLKALVEAKSTQHIKEFLKDKGYEVSSLEIGSDRLDRDAHLKEAWFDIQTLYKQALKDIKANKKKTFTYEIGSGPNYFAENHKADVIVLTRQTGTKLSQGVIAAQITQAVAALATTLLSGVAIGGGAQPLQTLETEISFVDAESGDILWYNLEKITEDYTKADEKSKVIFNHIRRILTAFPESKFKRESPKPDKPAVQSSGVRATNVMPAVASKTPTAT